MPQVKFEPTIPVFERVKTVNALDRAATVIGTFLSPRGILRELNHHRSFPILSIHH
jgi:hypothetical protein